MTNKAKRVLTTVLIYILLVVNFTVHDTFITMVFAYAIYWIISTCLASLIFKRKDDEPEGPSE